MSDVEKLIARARSVAQSTPEFLDLKGPGMGDRATNTFMKRLREELAVHVPTALPEQRICGENKLAVDFYIESEAVVVEVAMSLRNSASEFERDILKAIMAQETGRPLRKLVFLSKPGALKRHASASSRAIIKWAQERHGLEIEIFEFNEDALRTTS